MVANIITTKDLGACTGQLLQKIIGLLSIYQKFLKPLHDWMYIQHMPSHSVSIGSQVHLFRFDKTGDKTGNKTGGKTSDKTGGKTGGILVSPYINILNNINDINNLNIKNACKPAHENLIFVNQRTSYTNREATHHQEKQAGGGAVAMSHTSIPLNYYAGLCYTNPSI